MRRLAHYNSDIFLSHFSNSSKKNRTEECRLPRIQQEPGTEKRSLLRLYMRPRRKRRSSHGHVHVQCAAESFHGMAWPTRPCASHAIATKPGAVRSARLGRSRPPLLRSIPCVPRVGWTTREPSVTLHAQHALPNEEAIFVVLRDKHSATNARQDKVSKSDFID